MSNKPTSHLVPVKTLDDVADILAEAKYLYDHGMFTVAAQGEFFKKMQEASADLPEWEDVGPEVDPEPPPPSPAKGVKK